ncbi:4Fe-4S double cluster binding domain-containing protein [Tateyamaria sp. ANG-S1]|uniref:4Fe-4S double cluster binding domain-containing protein n=1 Tax=Tateyamaria sp. ANG-S1 TaxID=1577905 RepID=UPI00068A2B7B|nr:4Fe-4S double cluster binding domain-containing protein [Tateyamaria sp. ANG-S1]
MTVMFQEPIAASDIKDKARSLGADLVGIADGHIMNAHPPNPRVLQTPERITDHDGDRCIVMAKRYSVGTTRLPRVDERHKYYNDELTLTELESISLEMVLWLEDRGYPAFIIPPTHVDPWVYFGEPDQHVETILSLTHAAVEAGLGTLGMAEQLITPEYGPRVLLTAVLTSAPVEADTKRTDALCLGASCGRCVQTCPADAVHHFERDWQACDTHRSPHGFRALADHLSRIIDEPDPAEKKKMLRSKDQFYIWQSMLRGAGVVTGCRRCQDVCPVGEDYTRLSDVLDDIPEATPEKADRAAAYYMAEQAGELPPSYHKAARWMGAFPSKD